ncbi:hypothetical protein [Longispora albida]|uniref:hypothetical protein n=1 Tax=Longispora albida TaxID=203523 RepID=UPI00037FD1C1|nr:hypothetical protein [Longispora albida]
MKNVLKWGALIFLVFFVVYRSEDAANVVGSIGNTIGEVFDGVGNFISGVADGN